MAIAARCRTSHPALLRVIHYAPPLSFSHYSSINSLPSSPSLPRFFNVHLHKPLSSPFPSAESETGDFDSDFEEPASTFCSTELSAFLRLLARAKSQFSTQDDALDFLRDSSGPKPSKGLLFSALWELRRDWESSLLVFRWAGDCVHESPWAWHLMIWALGKQRRFDLAWIFVRRMHRKSLLTRRALVIMMERYASANEAGKAIKTFNALGKFNINVDLATIYDLLHALCKNKNIEEAEEFLLAQQKVFPLEISGFNIILDGWCNILVDVIEAKRVWREMEKYCVTPDGTSYTCMVGCFSKFGNLFDSLRLYGEMKKRGFLPNLKVYNSLISVLTREGCMKEAHSIFNKIMEARLQPDLETYNCMIIPLCEAYKLDEAHEVMKMMILRGVHPSRETYHALVRIDDFEGTLRLVKEMRDTGCKPNGNTFLLIFNKFFRMGRSESALRMWNEMRNYVVPDTSHYATMIKGLTDDGWIQKAMEFYGDMKSKGFTVEPKFEKLFKSFLSDNKNHCASSGKEYIVRKHERNTILKGLKLGIEELSYHMFDSRAAASKRSDWRKK